MRSPQEALRAAYPPALASLVRIAGDLETAQDVLHEAAERALTRWTAQMPTQPAAWLVRVSQNILVDRQRRVFVRERHALQDRWQVDSPTGLEDPLVAGFRDDMLRLIFTCCHPVLPKDSQVALTLRTVAGLPLDQIAAAFLVTVPTMEQRLVRARRRLREARVRYETPSAEELPERLSAVCAVVLHIFNDGYSYSRHGPSLRPRLCELAIRLARLLERLMRPSAEASGLLALLLLQHSRWQARTVDLPRFVSLEEQDRTLWDRRLIREGQALVERALRRRDVGPFQIQAAIAAVHSSAASHEQTDWPQIVALYDALERHQPTAVVHLNRAIAIAQAGDPNESLGLLDAIGRSGALGEYRYFHIAMGYVRAMLGDVGGATKAYRRALELVDNDVERTHLRTEIEKLEKSHA
ncbi:MAG: DUF6596 domain-containing protein [Myxococcota bacterium]